MFAFHVTKTLALQWVRFEVEDFDLLIDPEIHNPLVPRAVFVASLNAKEELVPLIECVGSLFFHPSCSPIFIFRTADTAWFTQTHAFKYGAVRYSKENHRPRWIITDGKWADFCRRIAVRVATRRAVRQLKMEEKSNPFS